MRGRDCDCDCDAGPARTASEGRNVATAERVGAVPVRGKHRWLAPLRPVERLLLHTRTCRAGSIHRLYERASLTRSSLALKKASISEGLCTAQELAQLIGFIEESLPLESRGRVRNVRHSRWKWLGACGRSGGCLEGCELALLRTGDARTRKPGSSALPEARPFATYNGVAGGVTAALAQALDCSGRAGDLGREQRTRSASG